MNIKPRVDKSKDKKLLITNPSVSKHPSLKSITSPSNSKLAQSGLTAKSREGSVSSNKSMFKLFIGSNKNSNSQSQAKSVSKQKEASLSSSRKQNICPNDKSKQVKAKGKAFKDIRLAVSKPNKQSKDKTRQFSQIEPYLPTEILTDRKKVVFDDFLVLKAQKQYEYSSDYLVIHKRVRCLFTIKKLDKSQIIEQQLLGQLIESLKILCYLSQLGSDISIQKLYFIFCDATSVYLVLEPVIGDTKMDTWHYQEITSTFAKVLQTLAYCHSNNIVLRNITTGSMVSQMGVIKLTNILRATTLKKIKKRLSFFGKLHQTPHQIVVGSSYDTSHDMWSLGLVLYEVFLHFNPFEQKAQSLQLIENLQFKLPLNLPSHLALLISSLLCEKQKRLSVQKCLELECFRETTECNLINKDIYNFWMFQ